MDSTLFFVYDTNSNTRFLVDSGASISLIPRSLVPGDMVGPINHASKLVTANGAKIVSYGTLQKRLDLGLGTSFEWSFTIADVSMPILGADFLRRHYLLVDVKNKRLVTDRKSVV